MNLYIRQLTAADRKRVSCNLEGYWAIFEDERVAAVDRDKGYLKDVLSDVYGLSIEEVERLAA